MKHGLIRIPLLLVIAAFFLVACNQDEDPPPDVIDAPVIEINSENPDLIDQPPVEPVAESTEVDESDEVSDGEPEETPSEVDEAEEDASKEESEGDTAVPVTAATVQHEVSQGEWLMQIARCYGVDYRAVRQANLQITTPDYIMPGTTVTVPNVGSAGEVKGAPCVTDYTVMVGDNWTGLAARFGTTSAMLKRVNPGPLLAGEKITVPAQGGTIVVVNPAPESEPISSEPTHIMFDAGETAVTVGGVVPANGRTSYIFGAREGQEYKITLAPTQDDVTFSVINPSNAGQVLPTEGVLPATGDYTVRVTGGAVDATFSLGVSIVDPNVGGGLTLPEATRINFAPGATSATVTGSAAVGQLTHYVFTASEGKQLAIEFTPSDAGITYLVTPPGLGNVMPENNILPTTGDYYIAITGGSADATFTLVLTITNP